ncbi:Serine/threonine-protein kinase ATR [Sesbania bispinosa]|nr:Serine/threonine-protein kinase ATR [Sesbania bispinosa]
MPSRMPLSFPLASLLSYLALSSTLSPWSPLGATRRVWGSVALETPAAASANSCSCAISPLIACSVTAIYSFNGCLGVGGDITCTDDIICLILSKVSWCSFVHAKSLLPFNKARNGPINSLMAGMKRLMYPNFPNSCCASLIFVGGFILRMASILL